MSTTSGIATMVRNSRAIVATVGFLVGMTAVSVNAQDGYGAWTDSATIRLNTSSSGAGVNQNVINFPVLVRLNSSNFDFSRSKGRGADIRFAKSNGVTRLPFQVEHWDSAGAMAAIWVKADTVYGNNNTQYLMMYWNRTGVADSSQPASVFPTANGFAAVWHLSEQCNDGEAGLINSTGTGLSLTPQLVHDEPGAGTASPGIIGRAVRVGPNNGYMDIGGDLSTLLPPSTMTVSAWFRRTHATTAQMTIVTPRRSDPPNNCFVLGLTGVASPRPFFTWSNTAGTAYTANSPSIAASSDTIRWHHLVGVRVNDSLKFYTNGEFRQAVLTTGTMPTTANYGWRVGTNDADVFPAKGVIDEVRMSVVARDLNWIRLKYQNQQIVDSLVKIESSICVDAAITNHPIAQSAVAGQTVIFSVTATGSALTYRWERDSSTTGWQQVAGGTAAQLSFTTTVGQDGNRYRCVVINTCSQATSTAASLTVTSGCIPITIQTGPSGGTYIEKSQATLQVVTNGSSPQYQWRRNGVPISGAVGNPYTFQVLRQDNGAAYTCAVSNACTSPAIVSAAAVMTVTDTTKPNPRTDLTVNILGPTAVEVRWTTPETDSTDCGRVHVYRTSTAFAGPSTPVKVTEADSAVRYAPGDRSKTVTGLTANTAYYFSIWVQDTVGNWVYADSQMVQTPTAEIPTNPVTVRASYVSDTQVRLTLSGFCGLNSVQSATAMWAEYIAVWYRTGDFVRTPDSTQGTYVRFNLAALKTKAGCPGGTQTDTLITVPALSGNDITYYLTASVRWHNPQALPAINVSNGDTVRMIDMTPPTNPCTISGTYAGGTSEQATVNIGNVGAIDAVKVTRLYLVCSFQSDFGNAFVADSIAMDTVVARQSGGVYAHTVRNGLFNGPIDTVYCRLVTVSKAGVPSAHVTGLFEVGRIIPPNPISLTVSSLSSSDILLEWTGNTGVDSIRTWRSSAPIPLNVVTFDTAGFDYRVYHTAGNATRDTADGLNASTLYYFAAQAKIGPDWTTTTQAASAFATTRAIDSTLNVENLVVIDSAKFDTSSNRLRIKWHYSAALPGDAQYVVNYGTDSAVVHSAGVFNTDWVPAINVTDSVRIELGENVRFNVPYYVTIRLRRRNSATGDVGSPSPFTPEASARIDAPDFWKQAIRYFQATGDTVEAFNDKVALWYEATPLWSYGTNVDVVRVFRIHPDSVPHGFIPVSVGFRSPIDFGVLPIMHGIQWDSIPLGFSAQDIKMYRKLPDGRWNVFHNSRLITARNMVAAPVRFAEVNGDPLILMIDTIAPVYSLISVIVPVNARTTVRDTVRITDNCANAVAIFKRNKADLAPVMPPTPPAGTYRPDTLSAISQVVTTSIDSTFVTTDAGARAYLIVSDGRNIDTVNLSRQVIRPAAGDIATPPLVWTPLRTVARLDNPAMGRVIEGVIGGSGYDNIRCRVYRWFDPNATSDVSTGGHNWVEYNASRSAVFDLTPGKLMWIKTREASRLDFGNGLTESLHDTIGIVVAPNSYTDIALPYNFTIYLGDILDATGYPQADQLDFYAWASSQAQYRTEMLYSSTLVDTTYHDRKRILQPGTSFGYSVFNTTSSAITLRVPPVCAPMSLVPTMGRTLAKKAGGESWSLTINGRTVDGFECAPVTLGFSARAGKTSSWLPVSPSFATAGIRLVDHVSGKHSGHQVAHAYENGGVRFNVELFNTGDNPVTIRWQFEETMALPQGYRMTVLDPVSGSTVASRGFEEITVPAKSTVERSLLVGPGGYLKDATLNVSPLSRMAAFPNPFSRGLNIQFQLPQDGIGRVELKVVDTRGRLVWKHTHKKDIRAGLNQIVWSGMQSKGQEQAVTSGMYLLEVSAFDTAGRKILSRQQRLTYMP